MEEEEERSDDGDDRDVYERGKGGGVAFMVLAFYPPHPPKYFVLGKTPFGNIYIY